MGLGVQLRERYRDHFPQSGSSLLPFMVPFISLLSPAPFAPKSTEESFYASFLQVNSKATGDCSWNLDEIAKMEYVVVRILFLWTGNGGKFLPPSLL